MTPLVGVLIGNTKAALAIDYAQCRACFRTGEIRILDSTGKIERTIAFSEADRRLQLLGYLA